MHTFCEVGQLNWIGPLSVDNPGVAVRQWQSRPSSRCYFNGPLLHSAYTPFKVLFFVKNIGQWHAKSGPKAAHGNFAMRKKKSGSLKKKWERTGRNASHFAHTHTHSAKLVVRIILCCLVIVQSWMCPAYPCIPFFIMSMKSSTATTCKTRPASGPRADFVRPARCS